MTRHKPSLILAQCRLCPMPPPRNFLTDIPGIRVGHAYETYLAATRRKSPYTILS